MHITATVLEQHMSRPPTYAVRLTPEGGLRVIRTDGDPITEEEAAWYRAVISEGLKVKALTQSSTYQKALEFLQRDTPSVPETATTRGGVEFDVDPIIAILEDERKIHRMTRTMLSRIMRLSSGKIGSYARGEARPQMDSLRAWAAALGWVILPIPRELRDEVQALVDAWREKRAVEIASLEGSVTDGTTSTTARDDSPSTD